MADDEIIILDDDIGEDLFEDINEEVEDQKEKKKETSKEEKPKNKNKLLLIIVALLLFLIIILVFTFIYISSLKKDDENLREINASEIIDKIQTKEKSPVSKESKVEKMIQKANSLYEKGKKREALEVYKQISSFNKAISFYNIGVAQMKEKKYKEALDSFDKAIENKEHSCVSALNAAVSSLHLNNKQQFQKYLELANKFLPREANSPLYTYYMSLINYYKNNYLEAVIPLHHPSSKYFENEQNYLLSKVYTLLNNDTAAINYLEKIDNPKDYLTLGLLYAKLKEYEISVKYLQNSLSAGVEPLKSKAALSLVLNRLGFLRQTSNVLKELHFKYKDKAVEVYPVKVFLKESLFDVKTAQKEFSDNLFFSEKNIFSMLFYFAPYKVFNAQQTINYIKKGSKNVFIDETKPGTQYLQKSTIISQVNLSISKGIESALDFKIHQANRIFSSIIKEYPNHSILHYNLALTSAQLHDFTKAYKHFLKSYHLDKNNYLAGIFAAMSAKLANHDLSALMQSIQDELTKTNEDIKDKELLLSLTKIYKNKVDFVGEKLKQKNDNRPFSLIIDTIITKKLQDTFAYRNLAKSLKEVIPDDIIANIIYVNAYTLKQDTKKLSKKIQQELTRDTLNYNALYYGPAIVKELYTKTVKLAGLTHQVRNKVKEKLANEQDNVIGLTHTLAYIDIYTKNFEEAYILYNELIDTYKQDDSNTIFLGAAASIAAGHHENAIALLELSKLIDPSNYESRYALGLLYQEAKNLEGAAIQFDKIGDIGFQSDYFDFAIDK